MKQKNRKREIIAGRNEQPLVKNEGRIVRRPIIDLRLLQDDYYPITHGASGNPKRKFAV